MWEEQNGRKPDFYDLLLDEEIQEDYTPLFWLRFSWGMPFSFLKEYVEKRQIEITPLIRLFRDENYKLCHTYCLYVTSENIKKFIDSIPSLKKYIAIKEHKRNNRKISRSIRPLLSLLLCANRLNIDINSCMEEFSNNPFHYITKTCDVSIDQIKSKYRETVLNCPDVQNFVKENEQLKARIADLEQKLAACGEQLEDAQKKAEQENVSNPKKMRTFWKYVLDLESRGMSDEGIRNVLAGDGFSGAQADALLYDGEGTTKDAVKKWGEKFKKGE